MPMWVCCVWTEAHGWVNILSNLVIGTLYFAIPVMLFVFVKKKKMSRSKEWAFSEVSDYIVKPVSGNQLEKIFKSLIA